MAWMYFQEGYVLRCTWNMWIFLKTHITEGQFQWFIDIISYLQFVTGETVSTADSQRYEVHVDKVRKTKDWSISISAFKTYLPSILGGLGEGKYSTTSPTENITPELWNDHDGVRGVYPCA